MSNDKLIKDMDLEVWRQFIIWCQEQGIPTAGRNARTGSMVSEIIRQHITKDGEDTKTKLSKLREILDRNMIPKKAYYAPQKYIEAIVARTMMISSPNLIRNYAQLCGYEYDRRRKVYKVPERATPAAQSHLDDKERIDPKAEKILIATMKHAEKSIKERERAGDVSSTTPTRDAGPGSSPGPRTSRSQPSGSKAAGRKGGKDRAANHRMATCPGCEDPIHSGQPTMTYKGSTWHKVCAVDDAYPEPKAKESPLLSR